MLRTGHASTMTLGIYNMPSTSSCSSPVSRPSSTYNSRPNTPSQHLIIYLSNDDPTDTVFITASGQRLYQSRTAPLCVRDPCAPGVHLNRKLSHNSLSSEESHSSSISSSSTTGDIHTPLVTRVSRLYGRTARTIREAAVQRGDSEAAEEGLLVAEMEWLSRTPSSRIRFGDGLAVNKQNAVDVRVDEFMKGTNGRGFSKMFATSDGRTYKWKTDTRYTSPAQLIECDGGNRVSGPLVTFQPRTASSSPAGANDSMTLENGKMSFLRVDARLISVIDQILVSWVIMERERRLLAAAVANGCTIPCSPFSSFWSSCSGSSVGSV